MATSEKVTVKIGGATFGGFTVMASRCGGQCHATGVYIKRGEQCAVRKDAALCDQIGVKGPWLAVKWPQDVNFSAPTRSVPSFNPSDEQRDIYAAISSDTRHIIVMARAGTGKTTTMVWCLALLIQAVAALVGKLLMLVFGKKNAEEMARKMPIGIHNSTIHSHGYRAIKAVYPNITIAAADFGYDRQQRRRRYIPEKTYILLDQIIPMNLPLEHATKKASRFVPKLVSMAKQYALLPTQRDEIDALVDHEISPIELTQGVNRADVVDLACEVLTLGMPRHGVLEYIDMDDMIYLPAVLDSIQFPPMKLTIIDEVQDVNPSMIASMRKMLERGTRLAVIGDPEQSIMGFRGSDLEAFDKVEALLSGTQLGCVKLPLTINRRCGKVHIRNVQGIVPDIQPDPNAPEGTLEASTLGQFYGNAKPGHAVLCRTNKIGIALARRLRSLLIPVVMKGKKEDGAELLRLVDTVTNDRPMERKAFLLALQSYHATKVNELQGAEKPSQWRIKNLADNVDTLEMIATAADDIRSSADIKQWIVTLFDDDKPPEQVVTISTIHRAKGLEWPVVWYSPIDTPHPNATSKAAQKQESNLIYVRDTRVRATNEAGTGRLIRIDGDPCKAELTVKPEYTPPSIIGQ